MSPSAADGKIVLDIAPPIATITIDRAADQNRFRRVDIERLGEIVVALEADETIHAVIVTGAGEALFSAGLLNPEIRGSLPKNEILDFVFLANRVFDAVEALPQIVIAAINGPCAGLGFVMALFCDVRFVSEKAVFTTAFSRRGLIAEHGIDWILPRVVGLPNALDLLLSARKIPAAEAFQMGLATKVFPHEELMDGVVAYAKELALMVSPRSMRVMKEQVYRTQGTSLSESVNRGFDEMYDSLDSDDFREGVAHFVEKRAPSFSGQ